MKSLNNPPKAAALPINKSISIIKASLSISTSHNQNSSRASNLRLEISVYPEMSVIMELDHRPEVVITVEDWEKMGSAIFEQLRTLRCGRVILSADPKVSAATIEEIAGTFSSRGYEFTVEDTMRPFRDAPEIYGYDSLAGAIHVYNRELLNKDSYLRFNLRDQGDAADVLKGMPAVLTSAGIPKPCFSAYDILFSGRGKLVCWGKYYSVIELDGLYPAYMITAYNYNDDINNLCLKYSTLYEVEDTINEFNDELNLSFSLSVPYGRYFVSRYTINNYNTIFDLMSKLSFPNRLELEHEARMGMYTAPQMDIHTENVTSGIDLDFDFRGIGFQTALIQKIIEEQNE